MWKERGKGVKKVEEEEMQEERECETLCIVQWTVNSVCVYTVNCRLYTQCTVQCAPFTVWLGRVVSLLCSPLPRAVQLVSDVINESNYPPTYSVSQLTLQEVYLITSLQCQQLLTRCCSLHPQCSFFLLTCFSFFSICIPLRISHLLCDLCKQVSVSTVVGLLMRMPRSDWRSLAWKKGPPNESPKWLGEGQVHSC